MLFFNVSSYLVQSRVRTLVDQARFLAQIGRARSRARRPADVLRRRGSPNGSAVPAERFPFTSIAIVPVEGAAVRATCPRRRRAATPRPMRDRPVAASRSARTLAAVDSMRRVCRPASPTRRRPGQRSRHRLVMRAVALPQMRAPAWAVVVDLPFTTAIEQRLRDETGIQLGRRHRARRSASARRAAARAGSLETARRGRATTTPVARRRLGRVSRCSRLDQRARRSRPPWRCA